MTIHIPNPVPIPIPTTSSKIILEARNVLKRYPGNVALDHVTFRVYRNSVNVLIGENGAGKSTLMRILAGVEAPDGGVIILEGQPIELRSPRAASAHGISIVHQELALMPNLDIAENIFAGRELVRNFAFVDRPREDVCSTTALDHLRKPMAANANVSGLSLGRRQIVELARTVTHGAKIVILDEPTSALSATETDSLFKVIEDLKRAGVTIIYISHRLHELLELGDHFTVLRSGRVVGEALRDQVDHTWIVERMSGRSRDGGNTKSSNSLSKPNTRRARTRRSDRDTRRDWAVADYERKLLSAPGRDSGHLRPAGLRAY